MYDRNVRDDTYSVGAAIFEVINCGFVPPSLYGPGVVNLQKSLDAYIDARIAEKAASKPSDDEMYARAVFATYRSGADKKWHTDFIERFSGPTAREVHEAWLKWLNKPCDGRPSIPSFPELEK